MFLEEKPFDYTMLIVTVVCFVIVVAILLFAIVLMIKKRGDNSIAKPVQINPKLFRNTLGDFFKAVGGTENVIYFIQFVFLIYPYQGHNSTPRKAFRDILL